MPARDDIRIADRLADARKDAGLSQAALARACGISRAAVSQFEQGRARPSLSTLRKIAEATHRPLAYFWIEDATVAMRAAGGTTDAVVEMLNALPPVVRMALELRLQKAVEYASNLPEWVRSSPVPANPDDLSKAIEAINSDLDRR